MQTQTEQQPTTIHNVLLWDWKERPTVVAKELLWACKGGLEATEHTTGSDDICYIVADRWLDSAEAEKAFEAYLEREEEGEAWDAAGNFVPFQLAA